MTEEKVTLEDVHGLDDAPDEPDEPTSQWREKQERQRGSLRNQQLAQDLEMRKGYARCLFLVLCAWLLFIVGLLVFQGFGWYDFSLSDSVLIAALGTTTVNVIGLFVLVARYLFSPRI